MIGRLAMEGIALGVMFAAGFAAFVIVILAVSTVAAGVIALFVKSIEKGWI